MKSRLLRIFGLVTILLSLCFTSPAFADSSQDQLFLQKLGSYVPEEIGDLYGGFPDESKIETAQFACKAFSRGVKLKELNLLGLQKKSNPSSADKEYVLALAKAGTEAYCPQFDALGGRS